jgi:hypothetical protein
MDSSSNQLGFTTLTGTYPGVKLISGLAINTDTLLVTGAAHGSLVLDVLVRSKEATGRSFDIIICPTGANATDYYNRAQMTVPSGAGNTGGVSHASLAALCPLLFDLDMAGNKIITLESGISIYIRNLAALTADLYVMTKFRSF